MKLEIVTPERSVFSGDVDIVRAPGSMGTLGILPHHIPLLSTLEAGELMVKRGDRETSFAISGGFITVQKNRIIVLADTAERADEIDVERARQARVKAEERLKKPYDTEDFKPEAALRRSLVRLKVGTKRKGRIAPGHGRGKAL